MKFTSDNLPALLSFFAEEHKWLCRIVLFLTMVAIWLRHRAKQLESRDGAEEDPYYASDWDLEDQD